jgi:SAM-dependent methyltransferase
MKTAAKKILRPVKHFIFDNWELLTGQRDVLTPPDRLQNFVGGGNFSQIGEEFVTYFLQLGGLQPWHRVLDVGCGSGRMAVPLTRVIDKSGSYDGLDIVKNPVRWCNRNIHRRFKNFRFHHADITNPFYNPEGDIRARDYTFPFSNSTYDFVFLTSVFTHLLQPEMECYLAEISRVMKSGARGLFTFFLLNEESLSMVEAGRGIQRFVKYEGETYISHPEIPELGVGYEESWIRRRLPAHRLSIAEPIHFINWCGR